MLYDSFSENSNEQKSRLLVRRPEEGCREIYPLSVEKAGYARWNYGTAYRRSSGHREFTIELVTRGNCLVTLERRTFMVPQGSAYILPPEIPHFYTTGTEGILHKRYLSLSASEPGLLSPLVGMAGLICPVDFMLLKRLFKAVSTEIAGEADGIVLSTLAYRIVLELQRSRESLYPPQVEAALSFFHNHLNRNVSADELAAYTGTSISHLNRLFSASLNSSPMKFFRNLRMKWAADLVEHTGLSIKEISYKIGFDNPGYFSFRFKEHYGINPRQLRQRWTLYDSVDI